MSPLRRLPAFSLSGSTLLALGAGLTLSVMPLLYQPAQAQLFANQGGGQPGGGQLAQRLMMLDADGDGKLSKQEAPPRLQEHFDLLDADGDGYLTVEEITAMIGSHGGPGRGQAGTPGTGALGAPEGRPGGGQFAGRAGGGQIVERLQQLDADGDGRLSREEAPPRMQQFFDRLDVDGDGYVTMQELAAMAQHRPQGSGFQRPVPPVQPGVDGSSQ